jgi:hypothetical protein
VIVLVIVPVEWIHRVLESVYPSVRAGEALQEQGHLSTHLIEKLEARAAHNRITGTD